jgi:sensor c-di-GMP phosphodiesterase-like protein
MSILTRRISLMLAATSIAAVCGTLGGYLLASTIAVRVTQNRLEQYSGRIVADWEASSAELRTVLAAMAASQRHSCSSDEIGYFRALIFESDFLKDAGRMRDGQIECSAALGHPSHAGVQARPQFTQQDGTALYTNLPQYGNSELTVLTLQLGEYFVAFTPYTRMHLEQPPLHYIETAIDAPTQNFGPLLGETPPAGVPMLTSEGQMRVADNLYVTQCSIRFFNCVTAYASIPEELRANRAKFAACVVLCGLLGAFLGFLLSLLRRRNKSLEQQLRRAIAKDKLRLVYQPIVNLTTGRIAGAEALARWTDEDGFTVSPEVFVRIAEEQGFVTELTKLVVRQALWEFGETLRSRQDFRLSINVTAADLSDAGFLPMLEQALKRAAVPAQSLAIEITESSTARHEVAIETIRRLRQRGHKVHIDDFGTGYSSLAYLHNLSVDAIKIDRAFTQAIGTEAVTVAILPQILAMAEALNLQVIVEGVETIQQAGYFASSARPVFGQGWLFGRPVPAVEFQKLLAGEAKEALASADAKPGRNDRVIHAA